MHLPFESCHHLDRWGLYLDFSPLGKVGGDLGLDVFMGW